jgi:hypothetical protein
MERGFKTVDICAADGWKDARGDFTGPRKRWALRTLERWQEEKFAKNDKRFHSPRQWLHAELEIDRFISIVTLIDRYRLNRSNRSMLVLIIPISLGSIPKETSSRMVPDLLASIAQCDALPY